LKDFPALKILSHAITGKNNIMKVIHTVEEFKNYVYGLVDKNDKEV